MLDWMAEHKAVLWWVGGVSLVVAVGSVLLIPWLIVRIPPDYFHRRRRHTPWMANAHPAVRVTALVLKNALGIVLVLAGLAMLFVPGQGLLTMLAGLILMDFPGKRTLERWIVSRSTVLRGINWMRTKAGHPPLEVSEE